MGIPVKYVGVGEQIDDLELFDPDQFVDGGCLMRGEGIQGRRVSRRLCVSSFECHSIRVC